ncbi:DUF2063 domain-containing protein [Pseudomonas sp. NPDC089534]|uniref:HvfC family RiPP maturation protein n=1 Tax=Pseudomonas sp. NPDC089534 TaxID=3364468 RepID=UPI00380F4B51
MDNLERQQRALTRYLRDPDNQSPPTGMSAARVDVYRDLVLNNVSQLLGGTFPILIRIIGQDAWRTLIRGFLRDHRAQTPKFGEIAEEFIGYLAESPAVAQEGRWPAFMVELAHYEWVEMVLQQSDAQPLPPGDAESLLTRPLQVSPLAWPLAYAWPVHKLGPDHRLAAPPAEPTLLLVRRTADFSVRFSELSPLAWRLLQRIGDGARLTGAEHLEALATEAGLPVTVAFLDSGLALLRQLHDDGVVGC